MVGESFCPSVISSWYDMFSPPISSYGVAFTNVICLCLLRYYYDIWHFKTLCMDGCCWYLGNSLTEYNIVSYKHKPNVINVCWFISFLFFLFFSFHFLYSVYNKTIQVHKCHLFRSVSFLLIENTTYHGFVN